MRYTIVLYLSLFSIQLLGQNKNVFLDRSYWAKSPTVEMVKLDIQEGHDPTAHNAHYMDPPTYAILENAPLETIEFLLDIPGNPPNKYTHDGRNYLMWAAYKSNIPLMKSLINKGQSNTDITDSHGYNLLTFAGVAGVTDQEVYDIILDEGIDIKSTNRSGANVLMLVSGAVKDPALIDYFTLKGLDISELDKNGNGAFLNAARLGNIKMMDYYISQGLPYNYSNKAGQNAIYLAGRGARRHSNGLEVFKYLVDKGISADAVTENGNTVLHALAGNCKDTRIIDFITRQGVDINAVNNDGNTFLMNAVRRRNKDMVSSYLPMIQNINAKNNEGHTLLTMALRRKNGELVEQLLKNGADIEVVDAQGHNLLYHLYDSYSERSNDFFNQYHQILTKHTTLHTLKDGGSNFIHIAVDKASPHLINQALKLGHDVNMKNEQGLTPLHMAVMQGTDLSIAQQLINAGADRTLTTELGESALDLAKENEFFIENKIDLSSLK